MHTDNMKSIFHCLFVALTVLLSVTACYDDYIEDYEYPSMGFSLPKQVRTVVSTTNKIYVGVSFGGSRDVDAGAWGQFALDETLLEGTGLSLLPESYYTLDNLSYFKVRRPDFAVADVGITFTDAFYADPKCMTRYYSLPMRLVASSIPQQNPELDATYGAIRPGAETTIIALKYICGLSGTYYKLGSEQELDWDGEVLATTEYSDKDLSRNAVTTLTTLGRYKLMYSGLGTSGAGALILDINYDPRKTEYDVSVSASEGTTVISATAVYRMSGKYTFYSSDEPCPQIDLEYVYKLGGTDYSVKESLVLRQWAEKELRVETF